MNRAEVRAALPKNAREVFALSRFDALVYGAITSIAEATGLWTYPMRCEGDFERMRYIDMVYWYFKAGRPVRRARRGSGLEAYFSEQRRERPELPEGFEPQREITVSCVGDLMSHPYLAASGATLYASVSDLIFGADVSMANLECVVDPPVKRELTIAMEEAPVLYLDAASFAAVTAFGERRYRFLAAACNHTLDFGEEGVDTTIRALEANGIAYGGVTSTSGDPFRPTILEHEGVRIGAVAYTFGLNAKRPPSHRPNLVHRMALNDGVAANDLGQLKRQVAQARSAGVEFFVAHLHWGIEHELYPTPEQVELAHALAELGVDAIFGHHPHVLQPMELYRTKRDPLRDVPIYYSLGNLVNPFSAEHVCRSGVARLTLSRGAVGGSPRVYVRSAELVEVSQVADEETKTLRLERSPRP